MQTRGVQGRVFAGQRPHERPHRGRQLGARAGKGEPFVVAVAEFLGVSGGHKLGEDLEPHRGQTRLWEGRADVIRATSWEYGRLERPGRKREAAPSLTLRLRGECWDWKVGEGFSGIPQG